MVIELRLGETHPTSSAAELHRTVRSERFRIAMETVNRVAAGLENASLSRLLPPPPPPSVLEKWAPSVPPAAQSMFTAPSNLL